MTDSETRTPVGGESTVGESTVGESTVTNQRPGLWVLDPTAAPAEIVPWSAPRLDKSLRGLRVGLRLDRSWTSYETVLDVWEPLLREAGAQVTRFTVDARVSAAGAQMRNDLDDWRQLVDCAVVGLGN